MLVVEDSNEAFQKPFQRYASSIGRGSNSFIAASIGDHALSFLLSNRSPMLTPSKHPRRTCILLDLKFTGNGRTRSLAKSLSEMKNLKNDFPVVILTTSSNPKDIEGLL